MLGAIKGAGGDALWAPVLLELSVQVGPAFPAPPQFTALRSMRLSMQMQMAMIVLGLLLNLLSCSNRTAVLMVLQMDASAELYARMPCVQGWC
jgi:hypothetical protein